jgi:hypothetical protein
MDNVMPETFNFTVFPPACKGGPLSKCTDVIVKRSLLLDSEEGSRAPKTSPVNNPDWNGRGIEHA